MGVLDWPTWTCATNPATGKAVWQRVIVVFFRGPSRRRRFRAELEYDATKFADADGPEAAIADLMRLLSPT